MIFGGGGDLSGTLLAPPTQMSHTSQCWNMVNSSSLSDSACLGKKSRTIICSTILNLSIAFKAMNKCIRVIFIVNLFERLLKLTCPFYCNSLYSIAHILKKIGHPLLFHVFPWNLSHFLSSLTFSVASRLVSVKTNFCKKSRLVLSNLSFLFFQYKIRVYV